ncbi:hypothetical protein [Streptomyces graminilatus]|uniref:hypothetical protein n=1 Tax=Streptomyces graminilatus TaxID=1464070 RepID=UPI0006E2DFB9|nr:hypothetical protein [Streptomyces graminilatus]
MTISFGTMPHICTAKVTAAIEAYSPARGTTHGRLDATAYVCAVHTQVARDMWTDQGLTPYTAPVSRNSAMRCGYISDFRESSPVTPA